LALFDLLPLGEAVEALTAETAMAAVAIVVMTEEMIVEAVTEATIVGMTTKSGKIQPYVYFVFPFLRILNP